MTDYKPGDIAYRLKGVLYTNEVENISASRGTPNLKRIEERWFNVGERIYPTKDEAILALIDALKEELSDECVLQQVRDRNDNAGGGKKW